MVAAIHSLADRDALIEIVMDLGRRPEARFPDSEVTLLDREVDEADIAHVVDKIGLFGADNRAGIERTLHRISAIRNRTGKIVGLTCRIGRAVYGTIDIIDDFVETGKSILIMGRPGIGKTTMLREAARVLADDLGKRVVVVDTSNEIAGDGDIPHPAIGKARRMQVRTPALQHEVMIEAVENHMPQVIVIDEIGTELEAQAARTIAERGVQLIGTAHGNTLDNLMLNPTLSDLIGGIQSVTLGDEEARRRRTQKSVLERKAPPTFDVIVEIQDRERVMVHSDVSETVDAMLRGDPISAEQRWKDEAGVHKSQSRPRPSPREQLGRDQLGRERFAGLVGSGGGGWRPEPTWRGTGDYRTTPWNPAGGARPGFRPGAAGGWRESRGRAGDANTRQLPGERIARHEERGGASGFGAGGGGAAGAAGAAGSRPGVVAAPFVIGEIADRGPVERTATAEGAIEARAREAREWERQAQWRDQAARALEAFKAAEGTGPANAADLPSAADLVADDERLADLAVAAAVGEEGPVLRVESGILPTLRVFPHGISRKRLEQAVKELQLPVIVARLVDEADVVMTLRSEYRQKGPTIREAEDRVLPVYVLKANTIVQMQASLTSIFALEVDPREAALRETEEAIGLVSREAQPVELAPQNAYIRRLQHQMAERANVVSRSRGREPYRRVRLYPDEARVWR
ncbi:MAG TPA: R3H domain-containing nucleic acid-binding protein [Patescibacteria group bacterium]|nr:R3H domain-containing nucleic acid-binding protein [Patescibacteria group bacterium]